MFLTTHHGVLNMITFWFLHRCIRSVTSISNGRISFLLFSVLSWSLLSSIGKVFSSCAPHSGLYLVPPDPFCSSHLLFCVTLSVSRVPLPASHFQRPVSWFFFFNVSSTFRILPILPIMEISCRIFPLRLGIWHRVNEPLGDQVCVF